jgi:hypothetical protein
MKRQKPASTEPSERSKSKPGETPEEFERFEALTKRLLEVSKRELDEKRNGGTTGN